MELALFISSLVTEEVVYVLAIVALGAILSIPFEAPAEELGWEDPDTLLPFPTMETE